MNNRKRSKISNEKEGSIRRWEDLDQNILKIIFKHVTCKIKIFNFTLSNSSEELLCNVSKVCRSWQLACFNLLFWSDPNTLDFSDFTSSLGFANKQIWSREDEDVLRRQWRRVVRIVLMEGNDGNGLPLEQWRRSITKIFIPACLGRILQDQDLLFIAQRTPGVVSLIVSESSGITRPGFAKAMRYWKNVTHLGLGETARNIDFILEIGKSCPQLVTLEFSSKSFFEIDTAVEIWLAEGLN
ncbi:F-box family protein [Corchorus capsularis]|uniref:F-box family protein n=1 Tax=Corchorus capsularis TaxID=210143 RepID=A0A1R3H6B5_COCAP|nr:F-box family protein [Corchorus capsularis]